MTDPNQPVPAAVEPGPPPAVQAPAPAPAPAAPRRPWLADTPWLRPIAVIAAVVLALSLAASAAVLIDFKSGSNAPAGSPESAVQAWAAAAGSGDYTTANTYLSAHYLQSGSSTHFWPTGMSTTLKVTKSTTTGSTASVAVIVTSGTSATPITWPMTFEMVYESGGWKIDQIDF